MSEGENVSELVSAAEKSEAVDDEKILSQLSNKSGNDEGEQIADEQDNCDPKLSSHSDSDLCTSAVGNQLNLSPNNGTPNLPSNLLNESISPSQPPAKNKLKEKVKVHLIAVGSAPILKKSKFLISPTEQFSTLHERLRRMLKLNQTNGSGVSGSSMSSSLFLYISQSFVPSPEDLFGDLRDLFNVRGELQVHYSIQEAWG